MQGDFNTTRWSLIIRIHASDEADAHGALDQLCRNYWPPLYAWLRGCGNSPGAAEEFTQGFFAQALEKRLFEKADAARGRLRSFLLTALKHYLADLKEKQNAQKRAGEKYAVSLEFIEASQGEAGIVAELAAPDADPARIYDRRWAQTLLQHALERLRREHVAKGREDLFDYLHPLLTEGGRTQGGYATAAGRLGMSENAARVAFHRMRGRFRDIFREEVARTLMPEDDLEEEMRYLAGVLAS